MNYRSELDGIRAIAVLLVVAAHLELPGFAWGGYTGVTLFFVLSGYLITTLLLEERERSGRVDIRAFYGRRVRRLLPALFLVGVVAAGMTIASGRADHLAGDLLPVAFYVSNLARVGGADLGWMPHAWSLSVEEQFYVLWPAVLLIAYRWIGPVCLIGIAAGLVVRQFASSGELGYGTFARGDAILYGCILAVVAVRLRWAWPLAFVVIAVVTMSPQIDALSGIGPVAVALAAVALISAAPAFLGWHPLVWLGQRSYGVYLWHMLPVLAIRPFLPNPLAVAFVVAFTLAAAWASFRWVEQPVRLWRRPSPRTDAVVHVRSVGTAHP